MKRQLFLLLCIVILFAGCQGQKTETATPTDKVSQTQTVQGTEGVEKDNLALNFSLTDMSGKMVELHSLRGKKAVHIVFWSSG
ncbi:MAG: hypothetical protein ABRQ37_25685 [Candidatus Eremiobacterota bacterium]